MATQPERPPVWQMIREAIESEPGPLKLSEIRLRVLLKYPGTNEMTINTQVGYCCVNVKSRVHTPSARPGPLDSVQDFLYCPERAFYELYRPEVHGKWKIVRDSDGLLDVAPSDSNGDEPGVPVLERDAELAIQSASPEFAQESHLRDYLARNLGAIESGLIPFVDDIGVGYVEYRTPIGNIDLIALDRNGALVIIELNVSKGSDAVAGQILRYVSWIRRNVAGERSVRGIILAASVDERLLYSIDGLPGIEAREYELAVRVSDKKSLV